jgi:7,8-dihydropterin-6-yl-methyl-4-(beta-D-ribofuranosyl)aminobenzene 5'-phosphate synthase
MGITIHTLVENSVHKLGPLAEYGLSLLITAGDETILFDTGLGSALIPNAAQMKIDLGDIAKIVLSHGHRDHTGGLFATLQQIGSRPVFAHPSVFLPKYSNRTKEMQSLGIPAELAALEHAGLKLRRCEGPVEISPGILASGPIPRVTEFEHVPSHFLKDAEDGSGFVHDTLVDDQAIIITRSDYPVVVMGCGHSGMINTLLYAADLTGTKRFSLVVGGTHLMDADASQLQKTMEHLGQFQIKRIAPCHCTGMQGQFALLQKFGSAFLQNATGDRIDC